MASRAKGIIVEIGGDTSGLQKALEKVNSVTSSLNKELKKVNSSLKLDPKNTELLKQKQKLLNDEIAVTTKKLEEMKQHQENVKNSGEVLTKEQQEHYRALQREIVNTEDKLKKLKLEASNWTKAGRKIEEFGNKVANISSKIDKLGTTLTTRLTLPIAGIVAAGIKYNAEIEKMTTAYETFLGSAKEAEKIVEQIKKDASKTPFDVTSLVRANQMLISTGENAEDSRETILALGDAITATGGGDDELTRMASNLQQIRNAGKATAMDIRQFAYAGIDIYGLLADYTGKATEEVKDMTVSYDVLSKALKKANKEGGKYYNAMNKASDTLEGQTKQLKAEAKAMAGELAKSLMPEVKKLLGFAKDLIGKFDSLSDEEKKNITNMVLLTATIGPAIKILGTLGSGIGSTIKGVGTLSQAIGVLKTGAESSNAAANSLAKGIGALTNPATLAAAGIVAAIAGIAIAAHATMESATGDFKEITQSIKDQEKSLENLQEARNKALNSNLSEITIAQELVEELGKIVDENGKIQEGYENRANFIVNKLNKSLGTEYKINGNIISQYKEMKEEIDKLVAKKKAEALLNAYQEEYAHALKNQAKATENLVELRNKLIEKTKELMKADNFRDRDKIQWAIDALSKDIKEQSELISEYGYTIRNYESLQTASVQNSVEEMDKAVAQMQISWEKAEEQSEKSVTEQLKSQSEYVKGLKEYISEAKASNDEYQEYILNTQLETNRKQLSELAKNLADQTSTIKELTPEQIEAWKILAEEDINIFLENLNRMPQETKNKIMEATGFVKSDTSLGEASGELGANSARMYSSLFTIQQDTENKLNETSREIEKNVSVENSMTELAQKTERAFNRNVNGAEWGRDLTYEMSSGMTSRKSKSWLENAAGTVAGWISSFLHFSVPDKGPLSDMDKSMPDMINLMSKGMLSNKYKLINSAQTLAKGLNDALDINNSTTMQLNSKGFNKQMNSTNTIFTTPQIVFNVQELDEAKLQQCFNYINRKFGSQY